MSTDHSDEPLRNPPVLVTKGEDDRASVGQVVATAIGAGFIIAFVLFGINNQRQEDAGEPAASTQTAPAPAQDQAAQGARQPPAQQQAGAGQRNAPSTTGQGGGDKNNPSRNDNTKSPQQPAGQNGRLGDNNAQQQPPQPRAQ